jgi:small subunit ribosomal protein S20
MAEDKKKQKMKRPTAEKRCIQDEKKRLYNRVLKSKVRTAMRTLEDNIKKGELATAQESLKLVYSLLDKTVKKGINKLNKVSRTKGRLTARIAKAA